MSQSESINQLFQSAQDEGNLSPESADALQVLDIGAQIQAGLGIEADDVTASEVVLLSQMIDDSGSIRFGGYTEIMREGHNLVIGSLQATRQTDSILSSTRYLNGDVLFPYTPITQAIMMDAGNYNPVHGTPLYDQTMVYLGGIIAKCQQFSDNGVPCRSVSLILSDGFDQHSMRSTAADCKKLITDMLRQENHIIAAMGVGDEADFRSIFLEMGIRDEWILTPGSDPSDIRKAFQLFSQSAVRASQAAASFSQTAIGGFGS